MLCTKLKTARNGLKETEDAFNKLSVYVGKKLQKKWEKQEQDALKEGEKALEIYGVSKENG